MATHTRANTSPNWRLLVFGATLLLAVVAFYLLGGGQYTSRISGDGPAASVFTPEVKSSVVVVTASRTPTMSPTRTTPKVVQVAVTPTPHPTQPLVYVEPTMVVVESGTLLESEVYNFQGIIGVAIRFPGDLRQFSVAWPTWWYGTDNVKKVVESNYLKEVAPGILELGIKCSFLLNDDGYFVVNSKDGQEVFTCYLTNRESECYAP